MKASLREALKKKYPQNCASENHFLIIFGIFFLHKLPLPPLKHIAKS